MGDTGVGQERGWDWRGASDSGRQAPGARFPMRFRRAFVDPTFSCVEESERFIIRKYKSGAERCPGFAPRAQGRGQGGDCFPGPCERG